jgi:hypothetical protein
VVCSGTVAFLGPYIRADFIIYVMLLKCSPYTFMFVTSMYCYLDVRIIVCDMNTISANTQTTIFSVA